jgi:hypothetical protein
LPALWRAGDAASAGDYATMAPMPIGVPIPSDVMLRRVQTAAQPLNGGILLCPGAASQSGWMSGDSNRTPTVKAIQINV